MSSLGLSRRENAFDFLRLFAALTVVIQHSVAHLNISFLWYKSGSQLWFSDGVAMFFILSGLLVIKSCENTFTNKRPLSQYFNNRFLRIAPGIYFYSIITVISFLIFGVLTVDDLKSTGFIAWFMSTVLLIPVYHPPTFSDFGVGVVNGSLWTIPAEFSFYIVLPLFVILARKKGFNFMIVFVFLLSLIGLLANGYGHSLFGDNEPIWFKLFGITFIPHFIFFAIGMSWSKAWEKVPNRGWLALVSFVLYFLIRYQIIFDKTVFGYLFDLVWAIPFSYALIWFGYNAPKALNEMKRKIGDLSFGVYIWHMVVVNYFIYFDIPHKIQNVGPTGIILTVIFISLILSTISWWLVEKPALKLKPYDSRTILEKQPSIKQENVSAK